MHPGTGRVGLFLPTTGLHHLLLRALDRPLVVTSGNLADEPIATDDAEARRALGTVADGFLIHDRPIRARYDDSVVHVVGRGVLVLRRARGYAPAPLVLPVPTTLPLVGAGARLKHTFTLAEDDRAHVAAHTGDLADAATYDAFETSYADLTRLTDIAPRVVAHDLHPGYLSTQWARAGPFERRIPVQHHHAHVAAVAAEHAPRTLDRAYQLRRRRRAQQYRTVLVQAEVDRQHGGQRLARVHDPADADTSAGRVPGSRRRGPSAGSPFIRVRQPLIPFLTNSAAGQTVMRRPVTVTGSMRTHWSRWPPAQGLL